MTRKTVAVILTSAFLLAVAFFADNSERVWPDEFPDKPNTAPTPVAPPSLRFSAVLEAQMLTELQKGHPAVQYIDWRTEAPINARYSLIGVYGVPRKPMQDYGYMFEAQQVGIFVVDHKTDRVAITLDVLRSERAGDFYPHFEEVTPHDAIVGFESDYGELARKQYFFDLGKLKRLKTVNLPPKPRDENCVDQYGAHVECVD